MILRTFNREVSSHLESNDTNAFFTSEKHKNIMHYYHIDIIMHGLVKMYVMRLPFCWTTMFFDLAPSCMDK